MKLIQLKNKDLKWVREKLLIEQGYTCAICGCDLESDVKSNPKNIHIDHEHFGERRVRAVLCRRCNVIEGRVWKWYNRYTKKKLNNNKDYQNMLKGLNFYYDNHITQFIHPLATRVKRKRKKNAKK